MGPLFVGGSYFSFYFLKKIIAERTKKIFPKGSTSSNDRVIALYNINELTTVRLFCIFRSLYQVAHKTRKGLFSKVYQNCLLLFTCYLD